MIIDHEIFSTVVFPTSTDTRRAVDSYWGKYEHSVLVSHLGGLDLPRNNVEKLIDRLEMTIAVWEKDVNSAYHL